MDLGASTDQYLARVNWSPDGRTLYVQRESRDQKRLDLLQIDPVTGHSQVLFSETSRTWINLSDNLRILKNGSILWWSQRDGYGHLYLWRKGSWTQLTRGPWEVDKVVGLDEKLGRVYFTGNRETPLEQQVYALDLANPRNLRLLTEQRLVEFGRHGRKRPPDGRHALQHRTAATGLSRGHFRAAAILG